MNIVERIREETRAHLDKPAIVEGERSISYRDLLLRIDALRDRLIPLGAGPGKRIAFRSHDGIDYVIGALGLLASGAAVVPVADTLTESEIIELIARIDVHGILTHTSMPAIVDETRGEAIDDTFLWRSRDASPAHEEECRQMGAAFIRFSSGTTGQSKGVVLSHNSIAERTDAANKGLGITHDDVILWVLGMSHHFVVSILLFLRRGATIIVANNNFPFSVLDAAQKFPITFIYASPVHYFLLGMYPTVEPSALARVRMAISTSMKMPADIAEKFTAKFSLAPREAYGIIEIGLPFINTGAAGTNTVGHILPDYELRIAEPDENGVGEVLIRGKGMFDAYYSPWRTREECLKDGWFDTGDLGKLDADGRLCLLGRSKTVIVCAGMKVFPEEVEAVINTMPGVKASLVSGREHPQFGQVPVAQVEVAGNVEDSEKLMNELRAECCRRLSSYNVPVEFRVVDQLPRTASGKIARATTPPATP